MEDFDKHFSKFVEKHNLAAKKIGMPLYSRSPPPIALKDLMHHPETLRRYMSSEEGERFRADYFRDLAESISPLARYGFDQRKQKSRFGRRGAEHNKAVGQKNRQEVAVAANAILATRARKPTWRELAKRIATKTGIPFNTVRGHLKKLREEKILD